MKAGKDDETIMGPLFPRLHVNDTDKGGPRAPPRNKMALYEQLSVPSQRFNPGPTKPVLPQPHHNMSTLVPPVSSTQGSGHERSVVPPFLLSLHAPLHPAEKVHSHSFDATNINLTRIESEKRSLKHVTCGSVNGTGALSECSTHVAQGAFKTRNSSLKRPEDEDDLNVPSIVQSENAICANKDRPAAEADSLTCLHMDSSNKAYSTAVDLPNLPPHAYDIPSDHVNSSGKRLRENDGKHVEPKAKVLFPENNKARPDSEIGKKLAEPSHGNYSINQERSTTVKAFGDMDHHTANVPDKQGGNSRLVGLRCLSGNDHGQNWDLLKVRNDPKVSAGNNRKDQTAVDNCDDETVNKTCSLQLSNADRRDDGSDASMVDSLSGIEISPDDVVGVIGPKQFWKARRALVNQQRLFALQVFELHRLIKVQKLMAASPDLLFEDYHHTAKSLPRVPFKRLPSKDDVKVHPPILKDKGDTQKQNNHTAFQKDSTFPLPPIPSNVGGNNKGLAPARGMTSPKNSPSTPLPESNPGALCYHPPSNQWLVPVMSPSEGLIYKPYSGPCPPTGFLAPVYGACGPISLPPAYGVPASHQQPNMGALPGPGISPSYFPSPYGLPVVNPVISPSAVEQVSPMVGTRPNCQTDQNSRSSCNMPNSTSEAPTGCLQRFQASKGSAIQGSTASSPCDKTQGEGHDALPLFPMAPADEGSTRPSQSCDNDNCQSRVIKTVPHNARLATESAARIFRSIQEERQQFDTYDA